MLAGFLLLTPALLMLVLPILPSIEMPVLLLFVGRFHPMFLHFPIVLIFIVLVFEVLNWTKLIHIISVVNKVVLVTASISSIAVVVAGYFLYASGDYSGELMTSHFRGGIFSGFGILATTFLYFLSEWSGKPFRKPYIGFLILTNGLVTYTSHMGGSLTHGQNYLTEHLIGIFNSNDQPLKPREEMIVYGDLIVPFMETKCLSCHNDNKKKGNYLMTSHQALMKGGESGLAGVMSGNPNESELLNRVLLPLDHDDHMPPEGKKPLTKPEIDILKFWISEGASTELMVKDIENDSVNLIVDSYLPESTRLANKLLTTKEEKAKIKAELKSVAEQLNVSIEEDLDSNGSFFALSMLFPPASFTDEQLQELQPYYSLFSKVSLVASDITDDGLYLIGKMTNLRELYLQKTGLNGSGLVYLQGLEFLERLNLSYTKISDASVLNLIQHPVLKEIYLHSNLLSPEVIEALRENQPQKKFLLEEGPYN